jgi:hypothetical protein
MLQLIHGGDAQWPRGAESQSLAASTPPEGGLARRRGEGLAPLSAHTEAHGGHGSGAGGDLAVRLISDLVKRFSRR